MYTFYSLLYVLYSTQRVPAAVRCAAQDVDISAHVADMTL